MRCGCVSDVLRMRCGCVADALRMRCGCVADALRMCCGCVADVLRMYCGCIADVLRVLEEQQPLQQFVVLVAAQVCVGTCCVPRVERVVTDDVEGFLRQRAAAMLTQNVVQVLYKTTLQPRCSHRTWYRYSTRQHSSCGAHTERGTGTLQDNTPAAILTQNVVQVLYKATLQLRCSNRTWYRYSTRQHSSCGAHTIRGTGTLQDNTPAAVLTQNVVQVLYKTTLQLRCSHKTWYRYSTRQHSSCDSHTERGTGTLQAM